MKANSSLAVLQTFARAGCGFDIVSGGELDARAGGRRQPGQIVFSGVGKTRAEMQQALAVGVRCFNVESESELRRLSDVATAMGARHRSACASTRTSTPAPTPTSPPDCATTSSAWRTSRRCRSTGWPRACPG
jgi:diaminopimelate decarboxylase